MGSLPMMTVTEVVRVVRILVHEVPELLPLLGTFFNTLRGADTKEEKISRMKRATIAAGGRIALVTALPGKR
jgi:hypothetical protein